MFNRLGDLVPVTIPGKIVAGIAAVTGVILIAMPISLLANNYASVFNSKAKKERIIKLHKTRIDIMQKKALFGDEKNVYSFTNNNFEFFEDLEPKIENTISL
jgi:hypothetical protein